MSFVGYAEAPRLCELLRRQYGLYHLSVEECHVSFNESILKFRIKSSKNSKLQILNIDYMNFKGGMTDWVMLEFSKQIPPYQI